METQDDVADMLTDSSLVLQDTVNMSSDLHTVDDQPSVFDVQAIITNQSAEMDAPPESTLTDISSPENIPQKSVIEVSSLDLELTVHPNGEDVPTGAGEEAAGKSTMEVETPANNSGSLWEDAGSEDMFGSPTKPQETAKPKDDARQPTNQKLPTGTSQQNDDGFGAGLDDDFGGDFDETETATDFDIFGDKERVVVETSVANEPQPVVNLVVATADGAGEHGEHVEKTETETQLPTLSAVNIDPASIQDPEEIPVLEPELAQKFSTRKEVELDTEEDAVEGAVAASGDEEEEKPASELPKKRGRRRRSEDASGSTKPESEKTPHANEHNPNLNINSRPRRSIARKSVFELLQVEYRGGTGMRKHSAPAAADSDDEPLSNLSPPPKKTQNKKATTPKQSNASTPKTIKTAIADDASTLRKKSSGENENRTESVVHRAVCYTPDDFDLEHNSGGRKSELKSTTKIAKNVDQNHKTAQIDESALERQSVQEVAFNQEADNAARKFAIEFEAATVEALTENSRKEKDSDTKTSGLEQVMTENVQLRARIKSLEEAKNSVKKFNIDFHSRKFSRIRSPFGSTPDDRKSSLGAHKTGGLSAGNNSAGAEQSAALQSRTAMLDRREHRLRELDAEIDERASAVRVRESALQRRERKLADFEKTLEYRERVLSRHEQSVQKRELEVASATESGSVAGASGDPGEHRSMVSEMQSRMEQRRLELDRRQCFLDAEREKLAAREREIEHREQELTLKLQHSDGTAGLPTNDESSDAGDQPDQDCFSAAVVTKKRKLSSAGTPSDKKPAKKIKVLKSPALTAGRKVAARRKSIIGVSSLIAKRQLSPTVSAASSAKKKYGLRKRSF